MIVLSVGLGCGFVGGQDKPAATDGNSNKTLTDKAIDTAVGKSHIGVRECNEVMDEIEVELNNSEDDFVTKAVKATILNRIKDGIKQSVEENSTDKVELAKTCREFKSQFNKYKAEQESGRKK